MVTRAAGEVAKAPSCCLKNCGYAAPVGRASSIHIESGAVGTEPIVQQRSLAKHAMPRDPGWPEELGIGLDPHLGASYLAVELPMEPN
jgi:hypothetical protein